MKERKKYQMSNYIPLDIARRVNQEFEKLKELMKKEGIKPSEDAYRLNLQVVGSYMRNSDIFKEISRSELLYYFFNPKIMEQEKPNAFYQLCKLDAFMTQRKLITQITDLQDYLLSMSYFNDWRMNKQSYRIDPTFAEELLKTSDLKLREEDIARLPCKTFWIDTSLCDQLHPVLGVMVNVEQIRTGYVIITHHHVWHEKSQEYIYYSHYLETGKMEEEIQFLRDYPAEYRINKNSPLTIQTGIKDISELDFTRTQSDNTLFVYQILSYLVSEKPDMEISPESRAAYHPIPAGKPPKDKFSEVELHNIGYVFGSEYRVYKRAVKEYEKRQKENPDEKAGADELEKKKRKPMRPNFVSAHWSRYWVGEGRIRCELRWIEPYHRGLSKDAALSFATIHNIKL